MEQAAKHLIKVDTEFINGQIVLEIPYEEVMRLVNKPNIVILKTGIPKATLRNVINITRSWAATTPPAEGPDTFDNNQHKHRLHISKIQQTPQLFHDHTFDAVLDLTGSTKQTLLGVFNPLRHLWNQLTGNDQEFGIRKGQPYFHPQVTHYPLGGSFFGRHWHPLNPQKVGTILALNQYGKDYHSGGTGYIIHNHVVETEGFQDMGDVILFRYDLPHWVSPSSFADRFNWENPAGRWVAVLPFYDPWGIPADKEEPQGWNAQFRLSRKRSLTVSA